MIINEHQTPGMLILLFVAMVGDACRKLLAADGLSLPQIDAKEIGIKLQGSLRPLVARAEDMSWASSKTCTDTCTDTGATKVQPTEMVQADHLTIVEGEKHDCISDDDVVVSFRLQPGSYALEAMRELMKRPQ